MSKERDETFIRSSHTFVVHRGERRGARITCALPLFTSAASPDGRLAVPLPAPLALRPRTAADDTGERLGMNRIVRLGDEAFDRAVYVESDAPLDALHATLASSAQRDAILELLSQHDGLLFLQTDGTLQLTRARHAGEGSQEAALARQIELLDTFVQRLPPFCPSRRPAAASLAEGCTFAVMGGALSLGLGALVAIVKWDLFGSALTLASMGTGLLVALLLWPLLLVLHRGLASGWSSLKLCWLFSLIGGICGGVGCGRVINCGFDSAPATVHQVELIKVSQQQTKGRPSYHATVRSWRPGRETESVRLTHDTKAKRLAIATKPGRLGGEWLVSVSPHD